MRKRGKDGGDEATGKYNSSPDSSMDRKPIASRPSLESILDRVNRQGSQGKRQREENPLAVIEWQSIKASSFSEGRNHSAISPEAESIMYSLPRRVWVRVLHGISDKASIKTHIIPYRSTRYARGHIMRAREGWHK